jgi:hypothetical protein
MAVPPPPVPLPGEPPQAAAQRERIRDLLSCELALGQFADDQSRLCASTGRAYSGPDLREASTRIWTTSQTVDRLLAQAVRELHDLRRYLMRERAGRNLPPALPFEEAMMQRAVPRDALPSAFTGPHPALQLPHPDVVVPRCMPYHTPVWDALIWRYVRRVEPSGCSQQAHLLRNYPPYSVMHSEPLEPMPQPTLPAVTGALASLSFHLPAVAAAPVVSTPLHSDSVAVFSDAPAEVDGDVGGAGGDQQPGAAGFDVAEEHDGHPTGSDEDDEDAYDPDLCDDDFACRARDTYYYEDDFEPAY